MRYYNKPLYLFASRAYLQQVGGLQSKANKQSGLRSKASKLGG